FRRVMISGSDSLTLSLASDFVTSLSRCSSVSMRSCRRLISFLSILSSSSAKAGDAASTAARVINLARILIAAFFADAGKGEFVLGFDGLEPRAYAGGAVSVAAKMLARRILGRVGWIDREF